MLISIVCPSCKASYRLGDSLRGKRITCPNCKKQLQIPPAPAAPAATNPAQGPAKPVSAPGALSPKTPPVPPPSIPVSSSSKQPQSTALPASNPSAPPAKLPQSKVQPAPVAVPVPAIDMSKHATKAAVVGPNYVAVPVNAAPDGRKSTSPQHEGVANRPSTRPMAKEAANGRLLLLMGGGLAALAIVVAGVVAIVVLNRPVTNQETAKETPKTESPSPAGGKAETKLEAKKEQQPKEKPEPNPEVPHQTKAVDVVKPPEDKSPIQQGNGQLNAKVLAKVKRATVHIRVTMADGSGAQGSGFFGIEPGIVLTNAHVLGMLNADSPPPKVVEITYQSGEPDSRKFTGRILGVDRDSDLAVLRVTGKDLPEPLAVKTTTDLVETQQVWVVGFPFGDSLGKNITISQSSVSSLRRAPTGEVVKVQVNGGMQQGNSGGPVVNTSGEVVGVSVSIIQATQINFAVPGEFVHAVLNGRATSISTGAPVRDGNQLKMHVSLQVLDPLEKVQKVAFEWWTAKPGQPREPSDTPPAPMPGDSVHQKVDMLYKTGRGQTDLMLPAVIERGQVIWIQPIVVNGAGKSKWLAPITVVPSMPIDKEPALLALKHYWGARPMMLTSTRRQVVRMPGNKDDVFTIDVKAPMTETMISQQQGLVDLRLRYRNYSITMPKDALDAKENAELKRLVQWIPTVHADMTIDDKNNLRKNEVDTSKAPKEVREDLSDLHMQIQKSLETLSVPLPGRMVKPDEAWQAKRPLSIFGSGKQATEMVVTYRLLGVRHQDGRSEAVISIVGKATEKSTKTMTVTGTVTGNASFDLDACQFSSVNVTADLTLADTKGGKMSLTLISRLERTLGKEILNVRDQLTGTEPVDSKKCPFKVHEVKLQAGQPCVVSLESFKGPGYFDAFVRIEDASGKELAKDDDGGVDLNSLVVFTPTQTGTYRIVATCFQPSTGNYLLVVRQ